MSVSIFLFLTAVVVILSPLCVAALILIDRWANDRAESLISRAILEYEFDRHDFYDFMTAWTYSFVSKGAYPANSPFILSNVIKIMPNSSPRFR